MRLREKWTCAALSALLAVGLAACATRGDVQRLEERVNELGSSLERVEKRAAASEQQAAAAQSEASRAASAAEAARAAADDAARRAEAIFNKSVRK